MKITGEADFFIKQYGIEEGFKRLSQLGYQNITHCIREAHDDPTFGDWSEQKLKEHYKPLRDMLRQYGLQLSYVTMDRGIYSYAQPDAFATRKSWCVQAVKVAAYLGCPAVVIRPAYVM